MQTTPKQVGYGTWIGLIATYLLIPALMLWLGKDGWWWQAWVYSALVFAAGVGGRWLADWVHPGLMAERTTALKRDDVRGWDRLLMPLVVITLAYPSIVIAAIDHAARWSGPFPVWANIIGVVLVVFGYAFSDWAIVCNRFFSLMVRIQFDRGHEVIENGPYAYVRHPAYAGNFIASIGMILMLDSTWAALPLLANWVFSIMRTVLEDKTLIAELPGYADYAKRVKWRLLPFIW